MFDVALQWAGKSRSFLETVIELREKGGVFRELTRARTSVEFLLLIQPPSKANFLIVMMNTWKSCVDKE